MDRKVFVASPTLMGLTPQTTATVKMMEMEAESNGWGFEVFQLIGDSLIAHARNVCVARFLQSDATEMFFIDSDVAFGPGIFTRLMMHRVHFVAAVYRAKHDEERYAVNFKDQGNIDIDQRTGLMLAQDVPFGCVRVSRPAIEKMVEANKDLWFKASYDPDLICPLLFNTEFVDHVFRGEDFYFCQKYRETGGRVWVDSDVPIVHVGHDGTVYRGNLYKWLGLK